MRFRAGLYFDLRMANILPSSVVADISGKLGDQIYSRNRGGAYVKAYAAPTGTPSSKQTNARTYFALAESNWQGLSDEQRLKWMEYASTHPIKNKLGQKRLSTGRQLFIQRSMYASYCQTYGASDPIDKPYRQDINMSAIYSYSGD